MITRFFKETSMSLQAATLLIAILLLGTGVVVGSKVAMAASLKNVSIVTDDVLRLGDIFDNVHRNADYVLGAAPKPGEDMTLNARTLYRIASAMDIEWRPATSGDTITIRREANVVPFDIIQNTIKKEIENKGLDTDFNIELSSGKPSIILPNNLPLNVEVSELNYNHQKDFFTATLVAPSLDNPVRKINVSGLVDRQASVPVLRSTLQNGDVIGKNDIQYVQISTKDIQHNAFMNSEDIVGMTPRRIAHAGKFIQRGSLEKPQLVERGEVITINFYQGPLMLTAKGKALESGAIGDVIRVTNAQSSRTISATVNGSKEVVVR